MDKKFHRWLIIVAVTALLVRAGLWLAYPLTETNDTPTYRHLAQSLENHGFARYDGTRTPGYPLFILLAHSDAMLYALQLALGVLTTLLIFYIAWRLSCRSWFAGLAALAHTLNAGQVFFEAVVLTETLATFLLFLSLAGIIYLFTLRHEKMGLTKWVIAFGIGLSAAGLAMTRPLFIFVPFWGAFFLAMFWRPAGWRIRWSTAVLVAIPAVIVLGMWVNFIHLHFKMWGVDSMGGYHLVNHTTSFFDYAPDEYAAIRETFLEFRSRRVAETGSSVNTIWDAIPTLMEQTHLNYYRLARLMGEISKQLILEHPWLYLRNLALGWWWFWRPTVFWVEQDFTYTVSLILRCVIFSERGLLFCANLLFLSGSLMLAWPKARHLLNMNLSLWFGTSAVWVTSILQTIAEHGDNPRFLLPLQSLVILVVMWWLWNVVANRHETTK